MRTEFNKKKALPVLYGLYKNNPEGKTYNGMNGSDLSQFEIQKAIESIEHNYWWINYPIIDK